MIKMTENDADDLLLRCLLSLYSAVITKPGAVTRAGETTEVRRYLLDTFSDRLRVVDLSYGTLDGGDVLFTGKTD
jgi:N-dimethylarginine dimethylaminohydrolase